MILPFELVDESLKQICCIVTMVSVVTITLNRDLLPIYDKLKLTHKLADRSHFVKPYLQRI